MGEWTPVIVATGVALGGGVLVGLAVFGALQGELSSSSPASAEQAVVLDFADGLVRDQAAITAAYAMACMEGWEPGCRAEDFRGDLLEAELVLGHLCSEEDAASCLVAGWARTQWTEDGERAPGTEDLTWDGARELGVVRDYAPREWRGADAFETACQAGTARGCAELGRCMGWGLGREQSYGEAELYLGLGCALGSAEACNWRGDLAVYQEEQAPEEWFAKACDRGLADGCRNLVVYDGSEDTRQLEVWHQGCQTDLRSCDFEARRLAEQGQVLEADRLYQQACEGGIVSSCESRALLGDSL